ncbi:MAG TPA: nucleotidyltransferase substrate binding protein, partial [Flavisolibacter sp.]|nr:nucleotidyltransferase substrate binding protein [Flavisolibacter sp.]
SHMSKDVRWEQRFSNYLKALEKLRQSVRFIQQNATSGKAQESHNGDVLDEMIREGLIQRFEYTHELAWNVMKDYAEYQGNQNVGGSRDATREAFSLKLIEDGHVWMDMISSRNMTSHTYNEDTANEIYQKIMNAYYPAFEAFDKTMKAKKAADKGSLTGL